MQRTNKLEILRSLEAFRKSFFTSTDLQKVLGQKRASLFVTCHRLVKDGILFRLKKDVYTLRDSPSDIQKIANQLVVPSYLSFESALAHYGILNQIPYTATFATKRKSKRMRLGQQEIEFHQMRALLFWGYQLEGGLAIAVPEKALLDQLYFVSRGLSSLDAGELNLHEVSKKKFFSWAKKFPLPTQMLARKLADRFGTISVTVQ